jgi:hypothetical protein
MVLAATPACGQPVAVDTAQEAAIKPAVDGLFDAFETHPLVALGDMHGLAQEMELYKLLIRDPRFARNVGNVVVEFGGAARQDVIDRYVNGAAVSYHELRQVWTDTVGFMPTVTDLGYAQFFAQVRQTNSTLPSTERIRVWLGEPPIVWEKIHTQKEYMSIMDRRNTHPAGLIVRSILAQKKKALVIYGGQHFGRFGAAVRALRARSPEVDEPAARVAIALFQSLQDLVEQQYPDSMFTVQVYAGSNDKACSARFDARLKDWSMPALAVPIKGTALERDLRLCPFRQELFMSGVGAIPEAMHDFLRSWASDVLFRGDAILFLGPVTSLTRSPLLPDLYLDETYRREIIRQMQIKTGQKPGQPPPPEWAQWGRDAPATPAAYDLGPGSR